MAPPTLNALICIALPLAAVAFGPDKPIYISQTKCGLDTGFPSPAGGAAVTAHIDRLQNAVELLQSNLGGELEQVIYLKAGSWVPLGGKCIKYDYSKKAPKVITVSVTATLDCNGPAKSGQINLQSCTNGYVFEAFPSLKLPPKGYFLEFYPNQGDCQDGKKNDPELLAQTQFSCSIDDDSDEPGVTGYTVAYCDPSVHAIKLYKCADKTCKVGCERYMKDITINTCYNASTVLPDPESNPFDGFELKADVPNC